nr:GMC oxidoreductase [Pseudomonadota bacterium]
NLKILDRAHVTRLRLEGGQVTGVDYVRYGRPASARAVRQIVLAAGAIGTPQIMMLSGLGPAAQLSEHGIEAIRDMPGVGANLQDHLQIRTWFRISGARTLNDLQAGLWGKARIAARYALARSGPMAMAPSQLGLFTRSHPRYATPNIEFHVQPLSLDAFGQPLHPYPAVTISVCNLRPNSIGSVRLASGDFRDAPVIAPNYLTDPEDRDVAVDSIRLARRLMATRRMAGFKPSEVAPGTEVESDEDLAEAAGRVATTIFHPVGTAKMGPEGDRMAVVDPKLAVRGVGGLTIADASVMPRIVSGNTHAPVVMIAERAAAYLADR